MPATVLFAITDFVTHNFAQQVRETSSSTFDSTPQVVLTETDWRQRQIELETYAYIKKALELTAIHDKELGRLWIEKDRLEYHHTGQAGNSPTSRPRSYTVHYGEHGLELKRIQPSTKTKNFPVTLVKGTCLLLTENIYSENGVGHLLTVLDLEVTQSSGEESQRSQRSQRSKGRKGSTSEVLVNNNDQKKEHQTINFGSVSGPSAVDPSLYYAFLDEDEGVLTCEGSGLAHPGEGASEASYRRYCFDCIAKDTFDEVVPALWAVEPGSRSLVVERMREHDRIFLDIPSKVGLSHHLRLYWAGSSESAGKLKEPVGQKPLEAGNWYVLRLSPSSWEEEGTFTGLGLSADPGSDPEADLDAKRSNAVFFRPERVANEDELLKLQEVVSLNHVPDVDFWPPPTLTPTTNSPIVPVENKGAESEIQDKAETQSGGEGEVKEKLESPDGGLGSSSETQEDTFELKDERLASVKQKRADLKPESRRRSWVIAAGAAPAA